MVNQSDKGCGSSAGLVVQVDHEGSLDWLDRVLNLRTDSSKSLLILTCDGNQFAEKALNAVLKRCPLKVFGGVFPAIVEGSRSLERGSIVIGFEDDISSFCIHGLSDERVDYTEALDNLALSHQLNTLGVFVDGYARRIGPFIDSFFTVLGLEFNVIGGGCGSLAGSGVRCVLTNEGAFSDCALVMCFPHRSAVGVAHGFSSVSGPFRVTEVRHNRIISLDWKPAFDVYRDAIAGANGPELKRDDFYDVARRYPFGVTKFGAERVIRDPYMVSRDQGIVCVGEVPEDSFVDVMHAQEEAMISAARQVSEQTMARFGPDQPDCLLLVDCISRRLLLGDRFGEELGAIRWTGQPMVGVCSIGEIANNRKEYLEFYNKTVVVGALGLP